MVEVLFAIILVAEIMVGYFAGTAINSYRQTGNSLFALAALAGVAEIFALAWLSSQIV